MQETAQKQIQLVEREKLALEGRLAEVQSCNAAADAKSRAKIADLEAQVKQSAASVVLNHS